MCIFQKFDIQTTFVQSHMKKQNSAILKFCSLVTEICTSGNAFLSRLDTPSFKNSDMKREGYKTFFVL
jgi:hypothetical protein